MSDVVMNGPQLRVGLINELLSEGIFIRVDHAPWKFLRWTAVLLLCQDATFQWNTLQMERNNRCREQSHASSWHLRFECRSETDKLLLVCCVPRK
jgi:hypothetical protein